MTNKQKPQDQSEHYREDEIDLRKLFQAIGIFFINIWMWLVNLVIWFRRKTLDHAVLLLILLILGGVAAYFSQKATTPIYKSSMLINSSILRGQLLENIVIKLNLLCTETDRSELSSALGISLETASEIVGFEALPYVSEEEIIQEELLKERMKSLTSDEEINSIIDRIQLENKSLYEIVVLVYDSKIIPEIEQPLFDHFKNNPFIKKRLDLNKKERELKIEKYKIEAQKLDSLKRIIYNNISSLSERARDGSNNVILAESNTSNPLNILREDMVLYNQELSLEKLLILEPELELISSFTVYNTPENLDTKKAVLIAIAIAITLGYLIIIFKEINSYLSRIEKEQIADSTL